MDWDDVGDIASGGWTYGFDKLTKQQKEILTLAQKLEQRVRQYLHWLDERERIRG